MGVWDTTIYLKLVIFDVVFFLELCELFFSPCQVSLGCCSILFGGHVVKNHDIPFL